MDKRINKILFINLAFIVSIIGVYFLKLEDFTFILAGLSGIIQLGMFFYWIFEESKGDKILQEVLKNSEKTEETNKISKEIKEYQNNKENLFEKKQRILIDLIRNGTIPSKEVNKVMKSVKSQGLFLISTLGGNNFSLKRILKEEGSISLVPKVLEDLGFKRVYFNDSLFVILKEDLPKKFRNSEILRKIIQNELTGKWKILQKRVLDSGLSGYEKWKDGTGFFCNICVINVEEGEINILYNRLKDSEKFKDTFSDEFKTLLMSHSDKKLIGKIISDKIKAKELINKISIGLIFRNVPQKNKEILLKQEKNISKRFGVIKFLDLSNLSKQKIDEVLSDYLLGEDLKSSVNIIHEEIQDYIKIIRELDLF